MRETIESLKKLVAARDAEIAAVRKANAGLAEKVRELDLAVREIEANALMQLAEAAEQLGRLRREAAKSRFEALAVDAAIAKKKAEGTVPTPG